MLFNEHHILPFFFCTWKNKSECSGFVDLDGKIQSNLQDKCLFYRIIHFRHLENRVISIFIVEASFFISIDKNM